MGNRHYTIDFVYKVLCIDDESGTGKSLFVEDIVDKRGLTIRERGTHKPYHISAFNANEQSDTIYNYILNTDLNNNIIIIDNMEYIDPKKLWQGIERSTELNTQWLLLSHGNFIGMVAVDAIRHIETTQDKDKNFHISFAF